MLFVVEVLAFKIPIIIVVGPLPVFLPVSPVAFKSVAVEVVEDAKAMFVAVFKLPLVPFPVFVHEDAETIFLAVRPVALVFVPIAEGVQADARPDSVDEFAFILFSVVEELYPFPGRLAIFEFSVILAVVELEGLGFHEAFLPVVVGFLPPFYPHLGFFQFHFEFGDVLDVGLDDVQFEFFFQGFHFGEQFSIFLPQDFAFPFQVLESAGFGLDGELFRFDFLEGNGDLQGALAAVNQEHELPFLVVELEVVLILKIGVNVG